MRFLYAFLLLFSTCYLAKASENICMRVDSKSPSLTVRTGRGTGSVCGQVRAGQNLFRSGRCTKEYCPIAYREGACKDNLGGVGWIRNDSRVSTCIVDEDGESAYQDSDKDISKRSGLGSCYQIKASKLNVRRSSSSKSEKCGSLKKGATVTPVGACGDFWCPIFFYSKDNSCKGIGYLNKGQLKRRYVMPCSQEVSSERTRRIARYNAYKMGRGNQNYSQGSELSSSDSSFVADSDFEAFSEGASGDTLAFVRRCTTFTCNKAANRGHTVNHYNGCKGNVRFGAKVGNKFRCTSGLIMHSEMQQALTKNLPSCVKTVARKIGLGEVASMRVAHAGCFYYRTKRGSNSLSEHAKGRAIDIKSITLDYESGKSQTISMHIKDKARDGRFYSLLYQCWNQMGGSCSAGLSYNSGRCDGGRGGSESIRELHNDHLHLTYNCNRGGGC